MIGIGRNTLIVLIANFVTLFIKRRARLLTQDQERVSITTSQKHYMSNQTKELDLYEIRDFVITRFQELIDEQRIEDAMSFADEWHEWIGVEDDSELTYSLVPSIARLEFNQEDLSDYPDY